MGWLKGKREKTIDFPMKYRIFLYFFPLNQSIEDEDPEEEEEEKPVPQFAIYGPHLVPLAEAVPKGDGSAG